MSFINSPEIYFFKILLKSDLYTFLSKILSCEFYYLPVMIICNKLLWQWIWKLFIPIIVATKQKMENYNETIKKMCTKLLSTIVKFYFIAHHIYILCLDHICVIKYTTSYDAIKGVAVIHFPFFANFLGGTVRKWLTKNDDNNRRTFHPR